VGWGALAGKWSLTVCAADMICHIERLVESRCAITFFKMIRLTIFLVDNKMRPKNMQYTNNTFKHTKQIPTHKEPLKTS